MASVIPFLEIIGSVQKSSKIGQPPVDKSTVYSEPNLLKQVPQTHPSITPTGFSRFDAHQAQNLFRAELHRSASRFMQSNIINFYPFIQPTNLLRFMGCFIQEVSGRGSSRASRTDNQPLRSGSC